MQTCFTFQCNQNEMKLHFTAPNWIIMILYYNPSTFSVFKGFSPTSLSCSPHIFGSNNTKLHVPSCLARLRRLRAACAPLLCSNYGSVRLGLFTGAHRTSDGRRQFGAPAEIIAALDIQEESRSLWLLGGNRSRRSIRGICRAVHARIFIGRVKRIKCCRYSADTRGVIITIITIIFINIIGKNPMMATADGFDSCESSCRIKEILSPSHGMSGVHYSPTGQAVWRTDEFLGILNACGHCHRWPLPILEIDICMYVYVLFFVVDVDTRKREYPGIYFLKSDAQLMSTDLDNGRTHLLIQQVCEKKSLFYLFSGEIWWVSKKSGPFLPHFHKRNKRIRPRVLVILPGGLNKISSTMAVLTKGSVVISPYTPIWPTSSLPNYTQQSLLSHGIPRDDCYQVCHFGGGRVWYIFIYICIY